jgi:magnesium chelatase family protein
MVARTHTFWLAGLDARRVEVEAHVYRGAPSFRVVGLADRSLQEARERVRSGVTSARFRFPRSRLIVNLAPAQERKEGTGLDLAIALAVLAASKQAPLDRVEAVAAVAELGLDGALRPVRGALAMAEAAARAGVRELLMAPQNAAEAAQVSGLAVLAARSLNEAVDILCGRAQSAPLPPLRTSLSPAWPDLGDVRGQPRARRALELAATGAHNLLMCGPPGSGKTMLARRLGGILPPPTPAESLEISRVYSAAGLLTPGDRADRRPFRAPHHSASSAALVGGASLRPGEVTLAHLGVLFLDELPEFSRPALEALRVPLEEGRVEIARAWGRAVMPSRSIVIGAMNPCPCGHSGDPERECTCPPQRLAAYRSRLSGPLLDRFDLHVDAPRVDAHGARGEESARVAVRVAAARARLSEAPPELSQAAGDLLDRAVRRGRLSGRASDRATAVARTIAALADCGTIADDHMAEALSYRGFV